MAKSRIQTSFPALLKGLEEGESAGRIIRQPIEIGASDLNATLAKLRNQVNNAVSKARREIPGSNFRVESGITLTDDNTAHLCVISVTRFDANGDPDEEVEI